MKFTSRIKLCTAGLLSAALVASSSAQLPVKPEEGSKHFAAVARHLELGGLFFSYMDVDGDLARLAGLGDKFIDLARKDTPQIPEGFSAGKLIEALGLNSVKALGLSSRAAGPGLFHNRALLYMPEGPKGLLQLFGGKAAPLHIAQWAPADAGMAFQMDLTLDSLAKTLEAALEAAGQVSALAQFKFGLTFPVPGMNMTAGALLSKLNTRVMVSVRMDEAQQLQFPGSPFEVPGMQVMVALDGVDFLMAPLLGWAESNDDAVVEKSEGVTVIRLNAALPGALDYYKPGLLHDAKAGRLVLTSHIELARGAGKGATLGGSGEFQKAMTGLPAEGNGLSYVTPQFMKSVVRLLEKGIKESAKENGGENVEQALKLMVGLFTDVPPGPVASVHANVPEGMLFVSNATNSHKDAVTYVLAVPMTAILAAGAYSGYQQLLPRIHARQAEREPGVPREETEREAAGASEKAVKNNLQQIALAAQTWFIDHAGDKEVTYEMLVKNELIFELDPVSGETYKGLIIKRTGGELSVKLKAGGSISQKYQAVTD